MLRELAVAERPEARSGHDVVGQRVGEGRACHGGDGGLALSGLGLRLGLGIGLGSGLGSGSRLGLGLGLG